ncbi:hypothetical protein BU15DRAFT_86954 [Melanogaster broomeanus]|nr:hypothetical protein BU15DRAFT_86954 [Melanogaster broomeanus]
MLNEEPHPLVLELTSLRQSAARFQHEAHAAAIKLHQHTLNTSRTHEHAAALEQENARLKDELDCIRANPDAVPHPAVTQVQELTLALRRLSEKIELTENTLLERTTELTNTRSELVRAKHVADGGFELAARMRAREEEGKAREQELEIKARASEEERRMVDLVVQEYADLVRTLEGRRNVPPPTSPISNGSASTITLVDSLQEDKYGLHKLFTEFSAETKNLHATIFELRGQFSSLQTTLEAERKTALHDRTLLSQAKTELDKFKLEDQTAAKMVSRYMKFSQASTNALQQQIMTLKARHASTISTLQLQLSVAESQLASEHEMCEDVVRETYGRRREVSLRLALLAREEGVAESMRRWAKRARELYERYHPPTSKNTLNSSQSLTSKHSPQDGAQQAFQRVVSDAESILRALDDDLEFSDGTRASGSLARIVVSREAVETLRSELHDEVKKRMEAVRRWLVERLMTPPQDSERRSELLLLTPANSDVPDQAEDSHAGSPMSVMDASQEVMDDPFAPAEHAIPLIVETTVPHDGVTHSYTKPHSPASQDGVPRPIQELSPVVSVIELQRPSPLVEEPRAGDTASTAEPVDQVDALSNPPPGAASGPLTGVSISFTPTTPISGDSPRTPHSQSTSLTVLLSSLNATKNRYHALQRAFRDCSLALKELKRTLVPSSPSSGQTNGHILLTALSRIDDYAEDARVELEIRVADEELTARGFETLLSVPGAFSSPTERVEVEESARKFADGTNDDVSKALNQLGKKLENVQHDVAVIKRVVHELSQGQEDDNSIDTQGAGWSTWTAGLLGTNSNRSRSSSPTPTFGSVMTSPRLRRAPSLRQLHSSDAHAGSKSGGSLASLNLRIPMPSSPISNYANLGLGRAPDTRPRTISMMYSIGLGGRAPSLPLGIGLGGSSPSPPRSQTTKPVINGWWDKRGGWKDGRGLRP